MPRDPLRLSPLLALLVLVAPAAAQVELEVLGTYESGIFDGPGAEIPAYDAGSQRLFVVNGADNTVDVLDVADPANPTFAFAIDLSPFGAQGNSVAAHDGVVAVAVQADPKTDPGTAVLFDADGTLLAQLTVGALPDMVTFSPDGRWALVANEGEPSDDYTVDPPGSVSIIDVAAAIGGLGQGAVRTVDFTAFDGHPVPPGVRVYGPGASTSQDLEPETIAVRADSRRAWVTLQENNALAIVHLEQARVLRLVGLGTKNHGLRANALDPSDEDGSIAIAPWPVRGLWQPDTIAAFEHQGRAFLLTANEGDARDWDGFSELERVEDLTLDPTAFPDPAIQNEDRLGRLRVTSVDGDPDGDGDYDELFSFGGRSFSIRNPAGHLLWDSGDELEQVTAAALPEFFNSDNEENDSFDERSDDKGPEPEGLALGEVEGLLYAFVGLERIGGIVVYEIEQAHRARFVTYANNRDFTGDPELGTAGDLGPEGLVFIPAADSPTGEPLLAVSNELSGTTTLYRVATTP